MRFKLKKSYAAAALLAGAMGGRANGAAMPFVDFSILGSTSQGGTYTSSVSATSGQTVYYEIEVEMAALGAVNGTHTITSLVAGTDGVKSFSYNLSDNGVTWNTNNTLISPWNVGTGNTPGTVNSMAPYGISGVIGSIGTSPPNDVPQGVASNNTPGFVMVETGSFVAGASSSSVTGAYGSTVGGFLYNDGSILAITSGDSSGYSSFAPLSVNVSAPEPASLGLLTIAAAGLLVRRRRRTA